MFVEVTVGVCIVFVAIPPAGVVFMIVERFLLLLWMDNTAAFLPILYSLIYIAIGIFVFNGGQSIGRVAHIGKVVDDIATVAVDAVAAATADDDDLDDSYCCKDCIFFINCCFCTNAKLLYTPGIISLDARRCCC